MTERDIIKMSALKIDELQQELAILRAANRTFASQTIADAWRSAQWEKKVWGEVLHLFASDSAAVSYLRVNAGYRCSKHHHEHRANQFTVISGKVLIKYEAGESWRQQLLEPRECCTFTLWSGIVHWFEVIESGEMVEVYWADHGGKVSIDDIVRQDEGGPIDGCST